MEASNILIAEFMGVKTITIDKLKSILKQNREDGFISTPQAYTLDELKYDSSWDWLMPVVEKIENTNLFPTTENAINVTIGATLYCLIQDSYGEKFEIVGQGKTKLLSVYQAVVEFIKEYNLNN